MWSIHTMELVDIAAALSKCMWCASERLEEQQKREADAFLALRRSRAPCRAPRRSHRNDTTGAQTIYQNATEPLGTPRPSPPGKKTEIGAVDLGCQPLVESAVLTIFPQELVLRMHAMHDVRQ